MSTFVIRFFADPSERFHGKVRHVGTGEEVLFTSVAELLTFFEGMSAVRGFSGVGDEEEGFPPE
ncbi:MAG: hypothetical protein ABIK65_11960 [Candidatus Eisenbacteria bacterium]